MGQEDGGEWEFAALVICNITAVFWGPDLSLVTLILQGNCQGEES